MRLSRWLVAGFTFGLLLSVAPSCGPAWTCGPDTCASGCCTAEGMCAGGTAAACGVGGGLCQTCTAGLACSAGQCASATPDAGNNGGADAGSDAGVQQPTNPLAFAAVITPDPPRLGTNSVAVTIRGANGVLVTDAILNATTWMPTMGHGSSKPTVTNAGGGTYTVSGVSFTMSGTWELRLSATAAGGLLGGSQTFSYSVN